MNSLCFSELVLMGDKKKRKDLRELQEVRNKDLWDCSRSIYSAYRLRAQIISKHMV